MSIPTRIIPVNSKRLTNYYHIDKLILTQDEITKFIFNYIGADCWGLTYDNEIIFNSYDKSSSSILHKIQMNMIRSAILDDIHCNLLVYIYQSNKPTKLKIHMFYSGGYDVVIDYKPSTRTFHISILE